MTLSKIRGLLLEKGMVYLYALFIAGYFLLPMAAGHRRLYYALVFPAVLLLWRELWSFYRGNTLTALFLAYCAYLVASLAWSSNFEATEAFWSAWYTIAVVSFCLITGFLWRQYPALVDRLAHRAVWLAAGAALVYTVVWYLGNPFPESRLEPLGVMHHTNKSSCAYGVFLVLCMHYLLKEQSRQQKLLYLLMAGVLFSLIVLTQSRTALAGVSVGLVVLAGARAVGVVALAMAASWLLVATGVDEWQFRVEAFSFRPGIWQQVIRDMQGHWFVGVGLLSDTTVAAYDRSFSHAHNAYLATLRDGGLVGLSLLLSMLAVAVFWAWRLYRQRGERLYLALLLQAMVFVTMDFDRLLVHPKELWLFFWVPFALVMAVYPAADNTAGQHPPHAGAAPK